MKSVCGNNEARPHTFAIIYIAVMAIYSVAYVAFDSNRGAMTNPLAAILYGVFVGGPALFIFLGLFYCWSVLL